MKHVSCLVVAVTLGACDMGPPPVENQVVRRDTVQNADPANEADASDAYPGSSVDGVEPQSNDPPSPQDSGVNEAGGSVAGDARATGDAAQPREASVCAPSFVSAGCDPVCNTGCSVASRCDVSDAPRSGRCVALGALTDGMFCTRTSLTDTCAPHYACLSNRCARLCYSGNDCAQGACCTTEVPIGVGASGFKVCGLCSP